MKILTIDERSRIEIHSRVLMKDEKSALSEFMIANLGEIYGEGPSMMQLPPLQVDRHD
jgi:hypothetical protein